MAPGSGGGVGTGGLRLIAWIKGMAGSPVWLVVLGALVGAAVAVFFTHVMMRSGSPLHDPRADGAGSGEDSSGDEADGPAAKRRRVGERAAADRAGDSAAEAGEMEQLLRTWPWGDLSEVITALYMVQGETGYLFIPRK